MPQISIWLLLTAEPPPEKLMESEFAQSANHLSDKDELFYQEGFRTGQRDLWRMDLATGEKDVVVGGQEDQIYGSVAPDGRRIAFASREADRWEVYVQTLDHDGAPEQVSTDGGWAPLWSKDGERIYFRSLGGDSIWAVGVTMEQGVVKLSLPELVFSGTFRDGGGWQRGYAIGPDGRFLMGIPVGDFPLVSELRVLIGWDLRLGTLGES